MARFGSRCAARATGAASGPRGSDAVASRAAREPRGKPTALLLAAMLTVLVVPRGAGAQSASDSNVVAPVAITAPRADRSATRLRWGVGGFGALALGNVSESRVSLGPGVAGDLGAQFGDHFALYGRAELSTLVVMGQVSASAMVEWTPVNWFSVGTGLGAEFFYFSNELLIDGHTFCSGSSGCWGGLMVPSYIAFNAGSRGVDGVSRKMFRFAFELAAGVNPGDGSPAVHVGLTFGYEVM